MPIMRMRAFFLSHSTQRPGFRLQWGVFVPKLKNLFYVRPQEGLYASQLFNLPNMTELVLQKPIRQVPPKDQDNVPERQSRLPRVEVQQGEVRHLLGRRWHLIDFLNPNLVDIADACLYCDLALAASERTTADLRQRHETVYPGKHQAKLFFRQH